MRLALLVPRETKMDDELSWLKNLSQHEDKVVQQQVMVVFDGDFVVIEGR